MTDHEQPAETARDATAATTRSTTHAAPRLVLRKKRRGYTLRGMPQGWAPEPGALTEEGLEKLHSVVAIVVGEDKAAPGR